ncbi:MAG: acyl-CoA dehydrogenase family protein [Hyphomicrobiaceae bacterium]
MNFELSEEQTAIRDMARDFAAERLAPHADEWDEKGHFPLDVMQDAAKLGMAAMFVDPERGGTGLSRFDGSLVYEALAEGCPTISAYLSIQNLVTYMVDAFGNDEQRDRWLPKLIPMEWAASYCLTEPGSGSDSAALRTKAVRDGDDYVLNGTKQFISGAGDAQLYAVMARTGDGGPDGISTIMIEKGTPGLSFGGLERKMGWNAQPTRTVIMEDARVPVANRLGEEGEGFKFAMQALDGGRINIASCSIGGAQAALDKALTYTRERKAFGKQIAEFQSIQFKLADMQTELEAARLMIRRAASALDNADPNVTQLSAMAKRFGTDAGFRIANEALQIFGGYGYLKDYGIEKIVRDLRVHQILEGTNEIMRMIIARKMLSGNV